MLGLNLICVSKRGSCSPADNLYLVHEPTFKYKLGNAPFVTHHITYHLFTKSGNFMSDSRLSVLVSECKQFEQDTELSCNMADYFKFNAQIAFLKRKSKCLVEICLTRQYHSNICEEISNTDVKVISIRTTTYVHVCVYMHGHMRVHIHR